MYTMIISEQADRERSERRLRERRESDSQNEEVRADDFRSVRHFHGSVDYE